MAKITERDERGRIPQIWDLESAKEEAKKYKTRKEFRVFSNSAYQFLARNNSLSDIDLPITKHHRFPEFEIFCALKKSKSWEFFRNNYKKEYYSFCRRRNIIDSSAYSHMGISKTSFRWSEEEILKEAKKYKHKSEFSKEASGAYDAAIKLGVLREACKHMVPLNSEFNCIYVWTAKNNNSNRLIKVGVTSKRLGNRRIKFVEKKSGFSATEIIIADSINPTKLESRLISMGVKEEMPCFSGSTEFIWVNESQYQRIKKEIENEAKNSRMV